MVTNHYVITGCAGSGTAWAARVMTRLGSVCGHQRMYRVDGVHPQSGLEGDSSFFAMGLPHDGPMVVLVRNPIAVVRSLDQAFGFLTNQTYHDRLTTSFILAHRPHVLQAKDRLGRILRYVATWDAVSATRLHVDHGHPGRVADIYRHLTGRKVTRLQAQAVLNTVGTRTNSHGGPRSQVTWDAVLAHPDGQGVVDKAHKWGYEVG